MPTMTYVPSRVGEGYFTDWQAPTSGDDGKAWAYNHSTGKYEPVANGTSDTRANILASSPSSLTWALSSDTAELFFWDGSAWHVAPLELNERTSEDMGLRPPMVDSDMAGYGGDYITGKSVYHSRILWSDIEEEGSIRTSSGTMQVYLSGAWEDVNTGFRFREDNNGAYELEHKPIGFSWWIEILSGNSDEVGLNSLPMAQQYQVSMGAYPVHQQVVGREITA